MSIYSDLEIRDDDLALDGAQAALIVDRDVILQDLRHALRESGLPLLLIGERSGVRQRLIVNQMINLVEEDTRVIPGSVRMTPEPGGWLIAGETYEFGTFEELVSYD